MSMKRQSVRLNFCIIRSLARSGALPLGKQLNRLLRISIACHVRMFALVSYRLGHVVHDVRFVFWVQAVRGQNEPKTQLVSRSVRWWNAEFEIRNPVVLRMRLHFVISIVGRRPIQTFIMFDRAFERCCKHVQLAKCQRAFARFICCNIDQLEHLSPSKCFSANRRRCRSRPSTK